MARLHGLIHKDDKDRGKHSTTAHHHITAELQTWDGRVILELHKDNTWHLFAGPHSHEGPPRFKLAEGTVDAKNPTIHLCEY